jgi:hypothetical protein
MEISIDAGLLFKEMMDEVVSSFRFLIVDSD